MPGVEGFMYPNEVELQWSVLIVLYPFLTGLVAGAFILASLERVFQVQAVKPTYRLALLTALAFLLVAPLPLQLHLGHPERSYEMYLTPHKTSAMAMFGLPNLRQRRMQRCRKWIWERDSAVGTPSLRAGEDW